MNPEECGDLEEEDFNRMMGYEQEEDPSEVAWERADKAIDRMEEGY